jgi:hypothetical protein
MKYVKMLGLLAVAAAALMAFAGTASATTLTSPAGETPTIMATSINTALHGPFTTVACSHSEVEGKVESHGAGVTAKGKISKLTFTGCNYPVTVKTLGSLEIHGLATTGNGALTSTGTVVAIHTSVGECVFSTSATPIGEVTGSNHTKGNAVLDIKGDIPRTGGSFFCGSSGEWTGNYTVSSPATLEIHG